MPRTYRVITLLGLLALCADSSARRVEAQVKQVEGPPAPAPSSPAPSGVSSPSIIPVFLAPPLSLDDFWRKLDSPDFVLISGPTYQAMVAGSPLKRAAQGPGTAFVSSVTIGGRVGGDLAKLSIKLGITSLPADRQWVAIGLDGLAAIASVREGSADLPIRANVKGGWEVELSGSGKHDLVVEAIARVNQSGDERKLTVPIPVCSSTALDLEIDQRLADAVIGEKELVSLTPGLDGERTHVVGSLTPRDRLVLTWRAETAPTLQLPPLLDAEGELAVDVDPDWVQTRSTWQISASRGLTKDLALTLDPSEALLSAELDGRTISNQVARDAKTARLIVSLPEPMRQGTSRRLSLVTRRKLASGQANRVRLGGYPIENAQVQTGVIAIYKARPVFIDGVVGRSLRRIDPRTELPEQLRTRPGTVLAYQFADQPFELNLQVDPSPPRIRVEPRTTVSVGGDRAQIDSWLDYNTSRGQVFDVEIDLAPGMELDGWGPEDVVSGAEYARDETQNAGSRDRPLRLILHLTQKARESGAFRVHLAARQNIGNAPTAQVELFRPRGETSLGRLIALLSSPGVDVVPIKPTQPAGAEGFSPLNLATPPSDWIWPAGIKPETRATATWLRAPGSAIRIPIQVSRRERILTHETVIVADVQRDWVEVEQETLVGIPFGTLGKLDIAVPADVGPWSVDTPTLAANDLLATEADGLRRYRLTLDRALEDSARFRFRFRLPLRADGTTSRIALTALRPIDTRPLSEVIRVTSQAGLDVAAEASGWDDEHANSPSDGRTRDRFRLKRVTATASYPRLTVRADPVLLMPQLVASRLLLRSGLANDGEVLTQARFAIENHGAAIDVELPANARWVRAEVNERAVGEIERRPEADQYRIVMPDGLQSGPVALLLEFRSAPSSSIAGFLPPRLTDGLVQQTYWEVRLPWNQLAIGVPRGWNDENRWEWETYVWKRKPFLRSNELSSWVAAGSSRVKPGENSEAESRSGEHDYLFSRVGEPGPLPLRVFSKAWLLVICTGIVSLAGVLAVLLRVSTRLCALGLFGAVLGLIVVWDTKVAFTLFQSSIFGFFLALSAWILQWAVDRRRGERRIVPERLGSSLIHRSSSASTTDPLAVTPIGSDDSTTIRKQPSTPPQGLPPTRIPASSQVDDQIVINAPSNRLAEGSTTTPPLQR